MRFQRSIARRLQDLRRDAFAASVTFLLGLPLALGAALASGAPATAGLTAAAVAGVVCGTVAGAPLMVTGPVVALATLSHKVTMTWGVGMLAWVVVGAGLFQLLFAALRLGRHTLAVAPSVLDGMLASVGLTLLCTQVLTIAGSGPSGRIWHNLAALPAALGGADWRDLLLAAGTVLVSVLWDATRFKQVVPGMLVAIIGACFAAAALGTEGLRLVELPAVADMAMPWTALAAPVSLAAGDAARLLAIALELALVGGVYSLLSAASLDVISGQPPARLNRELLGQGLANLLSGFLGGLPVSGAVLRSNANLRAGAASSTAMILQGLLMLLALTQLRPLLRLVPTSAIAATFLYLGARLVHPRQLRAQARAGELLPFVATMVAGLTVNLFVGVLVGLAASALQTLTRLARLEIEVSALGGSAYLVRFDGIGCFAHVPRVLAQLRELPSEAEARVELRCRFADHAFRRAVAGWCESHCLGAGRASMVELPASSAAPASQAA